MEVLVFVYFVNLLSKTTCEKGRGGGATVTEKGTGDEREGGDRRGLTWCFYF